MDNTDKQVQTAGMEQNRKIKIKSRRRKLRLVKHPKHEIETNNIIRIQSYWRGARFRKSMSKLSDNYTFPILMNCYEHYIAYIDFIKSVNEQLSKKKLRNGNFPSNISENIVKFAINKYYGIMPCWDTDSGDLVLNKGNVFRQIEIKGFMSTGPSSFGPTEKWDILYFVDVIDLQNKKCKVFEINLSNKSDKFRQVKISKKETFGMIADTGRRPRAQFYSVLQPQLLEHCKLIFDGFVSELDNRS